MSSYYGLAPAKYAPDPFTPFETALRGLPAEYASNSLDLIETTTRKVAQNPKEPKFRRLRLTNEKIADAITNVDGAFEVMAQMGWIIDAEGEEAFLVLPEAVVLGFPEHVVKILEAKQWYSKEVEKERRRAGLSSLQHGVEKFRSPSPQVPLPDEKKNALQEAVAARAVKYEADKLLGKDAASYNKANADAPARVGEAPPRVTRETTSGTLNSKGSKQVKSSFDFESRSKKEAEAKGVENELAALRELQKQKYSEFEANPNARDAPSYQKPASTSQPNQGDGGTWWNPTTWFNGGSNDDDKRGGGSNGQARKPRIKSMSDLPKPPAAGG